jgi:poly-beta-1,6-N-acetyl-D-glucosamine synthase
VPPETILDDVYIPLHVIKQGSRVVFDARARAWDLPDQGGGHEFARKVRTLGGNYQLLQLAPWLLTRANPVRFEFVSHKLLRLVAPFALAFALVTSALLPHPVYRIAFGLQAAFYALSLLAMAHLKRGPLARLADAALTFVVLNTAAVVAFANFISGRKAVWVR